LSYTQEKNTRRGKRERQHGRQHASGFLKPLLFNTQSLENNHLSPWPLFSF